MEQHDELVARQIAKMKDGLVDTERAWGTLHIKLVDKLQGLADTFFVLGRYSEAEPLYWRIVELRIRNLGERHPDTLKGMIDLADVSQALNKNEEAAKYYSCAIRTLMDLANECGGFTPMLSVAGMKLMELKTGAKSSVNRVEKERIALVPPTTFAGAL
jgi:tetratricopeptide (TPR) repeat protein